jgi:hypothetical protein
MRALQFAFLLPDHLNIDLLARRTSDLILPHPQIALIIRDGLITIGTAIRKFLNDLFF